MRVVRNVVRWLLSQHPFAFGRKRGEWYPIGLISHAECLPRFHGAAYQRELRTVTAVIPLNIAISAWVGIERRLRYGLWAWTETKKDGFWRDGYECGKREAEIRLRHELEESNWALRTSIGAFMREKDSGRG